MVNLEAITRVSSLVFIGLSFIGWIVFVIGFAELIHEYNDFHDGDFNPEDEPTLYAYWATSVIGPIVHILAVLHALLFPTILKGIPGSIIGSITAAIVVLYLNAVGYAVVAAAISIDKGQYFDYYEDDYQGYYDYYNEHGDVNFDDAINLLFSGGLLTTIFMGVHLAFWPWFKISHGTPARHRDTQNITEMSSV